MRNVESVQELFTLPQERLANILGNANSAKQLWEFIHTDNKGRVQPQTSSKVRRWTSWTCWKQAVTVYYV